MQFFTTGQHALENGIKCCAYGMSGAGKTKLIKTAPRPFILAAERGTLSLAKENLRGAYINTIADLNEAYDFLTTSADGRNYDTVCVDSWTEVGDKLLSDEKRVAKDPRQAYGEMADQLDVTIRRYVNMPGKNLYVTAKAEQMKMPDGTTMFSARMPGQKAGPGLPFHFDEFFFLGVGEVLQGVQRVKYRYLLTERDTMYEAKDRSGALSPLEEPDLTKIFAKIRAFIGAPKP